MVVGEATGSPVADTLDDNIPAPELEGDVAASVSAAVVALLYLWLRRRADRPLALALTFTFAFATSMLSSVSRALWNVGPALLLVMLVLFALDEHLRDAGRGRVLGATIVCGIAPVWIYATRPSATVVGLVAIWVIARRTPWHLFPLAITGVLSLIVVRLINDATWGSGGHPYYTRRTSDPQFKLEALLANIVSPARGLLIWSPILILAVTGVVVARRHPAGPLVQPLIAPFAAWIVVHLILISTMEKIWWAGFSTGPRLMADALRAWILLMIPAATQLRRLAGVEKLWATTAVAGLLAASLAIHVHAATDFDVHLWNADGDIEPRIWEWSDPPFLR